MKIREILNKKILYIIMLAFLLRILYFRVGETFTSSDEIYLIQNSFKPLTFLLEYSFPHYIAELFRFFNFNWGWGTIAVDTIFVFFLQILKIPLTEAIIEFPYILVGTATVYVMYCLGKELRDEQTGLIAALLIAILPEQVSLSRSGGVNTVVATFFFLLTMYLFLSYFKYRKYPHLKYFVLGIYFCADFQFYGIVPLLLVLGMLFRYQYNFIKESFRLIKELIWTKSLIFFFIPIIPTFLGLFYLFSKGLTKNSYMAHIFQKSNYWGFYFSDYISCLYKNVGPAMMILFILGFTYCLFQILKKRIEKIHLFIFIWFCVEAFPWIFVVVPKSTVTADYIMHPTSALILLTAFLLVDVQKKLSIKKCVSYFLLFLIVLPTIITTSALVYRQIPFYDNHRFPLILEKDRTEVDVFGLALNLHRGIVGTNTGIKSAGYYIRQNSNDSAVVFSDHESFITEYYVGRTVVGDLDLLEEEEILESYEKYARQINITYIYLEEKEYTLLKESITNDGFFPIVIIMQKNTILGRLYGKEQVSPIIMDVAIVDPLFNDKYGNLQSLYVDYP